MLGAELYALTDVERGIFGILDEILGEYCVKYVNHVTLDLRIAYYDVLNFGPPTRTFTIAGFYGWTHMGAPVSKRPDFSVKILVTNLKVQTYIFPGDQDDFDQGAWNMENPDSVYDMTQYIRDFLDEVCKK